MAAEHVGPIHLVLSDVVMPGAGGRAAAAAVLANHPEARVVFMSGYTDDRVMRHGIQSSKVAFIQKPFDMEELLARVRAALRRSAVGDAALVVEAGGVRLDVTERRATRDGVEVRLTPTEWHIVEVLARREGRLVRQADLLHEVWGPGYDRETNYLRVYLAQLRRKLEVDPSRPTMFLTDPGIGYRLVVPRPS